MAISAHFSQLTPVFHRKKCPAIIDRQFSAMTESEISLSEMEKIASNNRKYPFDKANYLKTLLFLC